MRTHTSFPIFFSRASSRHFAVLLPLENYLPFALRQRSIIHHVDDRGAILRISGSHCSGQSVFYEATQN